MMRGDGLPALDASCKVIMSVSFTLNMPAIQNGTTCSRQKDE